MHGIYNIKFIFHVKEISGHLKYEHRSLNVVYGNNYFVFRESKNIQKCEMQFQMLKELLVYGVPRLKMSVFSLHNRAHHSIIHAIYSVVSQVMFSSPSLEPGHISRCFHPLNRLVSSPKFQCALFNILTN
jgi:hypothetical protein